MLVQTKNLSKYYGNDIIIDKLSFSINETDKLALVGKNGVGKTSLLNIIAQLDTDFDGELSVTKNKSYTKQTIAPPSTERSENVFESLLSSFAPLIKIKKRLNELEHAMQKTNSPELEESYGKLLYEFEKQGGYEIENKVSRVLDGLGFSLASQKKDIASLSGGELRRVFLARLLLGDFNLLILDEPTNHLDIFSIKWLEDYLKEYKKAILFASHDRYFIERIANKIIELPSNRLYHGNYSFYLAEKEKLMSLNEKEYNKEQKKIIKEKDFIAKNIAGQKTKQAKSRRKALEKMKPVNLLKKEKELAINFKDGLSTIKEIARTENVSKSYANNLLLDKVSFAIAKGDKIGLIGKNGSGKTTLIELLLKKAKGTFINEDIKTAYFSQHTKEIDKELSIFETIQTANHNLSRQEVINLVARFNFGGDDINKEIKYLSGGELTKIALILILTKEADFLILDEPTNHLDIKTREALGRSLTQFRGTILCSSHDRYFLDSFVTRLLLLDKGKLLSFYGGFKENKDKFILKEKASPPNTALSKTHKTSKTNMASTTESDYKKSKNINAFKLQKIEKSISNLEDKKKELAKQLEDEDVYADYKKVQSIKESLKLVEEELKTKYDNWLSVQGD